MIERLGVRRFKKAASVAEAYATDALEAAKPKVQPMETAPKDGTKIALLVAGSAWVAPCEWREGGVISEDGFWLHWNFVEGSYFNEVLKPAGWFPLPDAPEVE